MFKEWNLELNQFLILLAIGAFGGWATGYPGWSIALVSVTYSFWMLFRARDLIRWLRSGNDADAPEGSGLWGALYDHLFQQQKQQRQQITHLHSIIARAQQSTNAIRDAAAAAARAPGSAATGCAGSQRIRSPRERRRDSPSPRGSHRVP